jgi:hypothetical protein
MLLHGMESDMWQMLGSLFGTQAAGEKILDGASNAVDKMFYTEEEKAEAAAEARKEGFAVYMEWLKSTSGSRLARRLIALMVTGIWAVQHILAQLFALIGVFSDDPIRIEKVNEASELLFTHAQENNALVGVVLLFYFGGPAAIDGVKGLVNKWVGK